MDRDDPAYAGQAGYSPLLLRIYDPMVLGLQARFMWRCPTSLLIANYRDHIGQRHLDVGPGTGFFLERAGLPDGSSVVLVDPNTDVLAYAARRLTKLSITAVEADVLKPLSVAGPFDSAALNAVLHCLPGPTEAKAVAIRNVADKLTPDGVLFGASVLGSSASHTWLARRVLSAFNRRGAFDNLGDTAEGLRAILGASFETVDLATVGSLAVFAARTPRAVPA